MAVKVAINGFGRIGRLAFRQMFGAEGYEVEVGVIPFQILQQQIGMDNDAVPALFVEQGTQTIALFVRKVLLPKQGIAEGQPGGNAVFLLGHLHLEAI